MTAPDESADDRLELAPEDRAWLVERLVEYRELLAYLRDR